MSFIDTLKKIFQEEKEEKKEEIIEIDFSQLSSALDAIQKAVDMHKEEIKKNLKDKISDFYIQMQQQIIVLEKINLDKRKEEQKIKKEIEETKRSEEYKKELAEKESKQKQLIELDKKIQDIKQKIDFKALAKHFHIDKKNNRIIQEYIDNFKQALERDASAEIIPLILEVKQIEPNLAEIRSKLLELNEIKQGEIENKIISLDSDIAKQNSQLIDISQEQAQEAKRKLRLEEKEKEIIESIKNQVKELNLKVR